MAAHGVRGGGQPEGLPAAQPAQPPPQLFLFLRRPAAADQGADLPRPRLRLPPDRQRHELPGAEEVRAQGPGGAERAGDARVRHEDLRLRAGEERRLQGLLPEEDQGPPALQVDGAGGADRERLHPRHRRLVVRRPAVGSFHVGQFPVPRAEDKRPGVVPARGKPAEAAGVLHAPPPPPHEGLLGRGAVAAAQLPPAPRRLQADAGLDVGRRQAAEQHAERHLWRQTADGIGADDDDRLVGHSLAVHGERELQRFRVRGRPWSSCGEHGFDAGV